MSQFHFGVGRAKVSNTLGRKVDAIAHRHGADFTWAKMPDGYRYWFSAPNFGHPFDQRRAADVKADLDAAGIKLP